MSNTRFPLHTSAQYSVGDNHMTEAHLPSRFATFERRLASQHLEDDAAESPHVHAAVDCYQAGGSEGQQGGMIDILALAAPQHIPGGLHPVLKHLGRHVLSCTHE